MSEPIHDATNEPHRNLPASPARAFADGTAANAGDDLLATAVFAARSEALAPAGLNDRTLDFPSNEARHNRPAAAPQQSFRLLGDYELLSELGRGGMGIVYRARQRSLNRAVAVKMVISQMAGSSTTTTAEVQRFQIEAEAAANLRHPGIVAIYEVGQADGCHFYSMEYVAGCDLAQLVAENSLSADQFRGYFPTGDGDRGLGTDHVSLEPSLFFPSEAV